MHGLRVEAVERLDGVRASWSKLTTRPPDGANGNYGKMNRSGERK
jgi:hypothetical protein